MTNSRPVRQFAAPCYVAATSLIVFPVFDQLMQLVSTVKLHDARWRFGAAGLMSNLLVLPVVGLVMLFVTAAVCEHRVFQRILSVLCALSAVGLIAVAGLLALDAIQVRSLMRPEVMSSWAVATLTALLKLGVATLTLSWLAIAGFRGSKAAPQATRRSAAELVVAGDRARVTDASAIGLQ